MKRSNIFFWLSFYPRDIFVHLSDITADVWLRYCKTYWTDWHEIWCILALIIPVNPEINKLLKERLHREKNNKMYAYFTWWIHTCKINVIHPSFNLCLELICIYFHANMPKWLVNCMVNKLLSCNISAW